MNLLLFSSFQLCKMATNSTPKKASSGSRMESMFNKAQKNQRALQDDYKNAPIVKDKVPVKKEAKHDTKSKATPPATSSKPPQEASISKPKPRAGNSISSEFEKKEYFDTKEVLEGKIDRIARWMKESRYCIVFSGAGISTSTGIPDFRSGMKTVLSTGPGIWERKAHGVHLPSQQKKVQTILKAIPSRSHMALVKLQQEGLVKFVVSQNTDGLHRRSGLDPSFLSELHGNTNMERCLKCGSKFMRDFRTRTAKKVHDHLTGRSCDNPKCRGPLVDSIINFNEDLPEDELENGFRHAKLADLCIVLGSSLRVYPAADIPGDMIERGSRVVIVNLQKTPLNKKCSMEVHSTIDDVVLGVMKRLGLEVPPFKLKRCFAVDATTDSLTIQGLDPSTNSPYSFLKGVSIKLPTLGSDFQISKEPFFVKFPCHVTLSEEVPLSVSLTLTFQGHYGEPELAINHVISSAGRSIFMLEFDVASAEWHVHKPEDLRG